ncbi:MAG: hypothetical protein LBJ95_04580 [Oscillospiraceae bacterium]|jgi:hypothetical protein|nr:hypothetical protein [Oscillospiraceae bacterium]
MKKRNAPQKTDLDSTKNLPKLNDNDLMNVTGGQSENDENGESGTGNWEIGNLNGQGSSGQNNDNSGSTVEEGAIGSWNIGDFEQT